MKKTILVMLPFLLLVSCMDKNQFNRATYQEITAGEFPIDTIDPAHDWNLLTSMMVAVKVNLSTADNISQVQILSDNPYKSKTAEILAEAYAQQGDRVRLSFEMPIVQKSLYAAAVTRTGKYYVVPFGLNKDEIDFSSGVISSGTFTQPSYQTFTYLFESEFPVPGDFDYNDLVMRIGKQVLSSNLLRLSVTVSAVGTRKTIGAAFRLVGIPYAKVTGVTIDEGAPLDASYPLPRPYLSGDDVVAGKDGSAVINLFGDAHWALSPEMLSTGSVAHLLLNTKRTQTAGESQTVAERTVHYTVQVADDFDVSGFTLSDFDPFVVEEYNGIRYEVHTYRYKSAEVLWTWNGGDTEAYNDHLAWALLVPQARFRYPIEGTPIGKYRNGEIFGAYNRYNHSFGQWGRNHNTCTDWFQNPSSPVY